MGGPATLLASSSALTAFQVPVVNVRPEFYSELGLGGTSNVLTTAPDLGAQARVRTESLLHHGCIFEHPLKYAKYHPKNAIFSKNSLSFLEFTKKKTYNS